MSSLAERFVHHPRHERCFFNKAAHKFYVDGKPWSGVHRPLKKCFFPYSNSELACNQRTHTESKETKKATRLKGSKRGSMIHHQLEAWIECENGKSKKSFASRIKKPHPFTIKVINACKEAGVKLLCAERIIFDEDLGIATSIDAVGVSIATGRLVLIELKTGFEGYAHVPQSGGTKSKTNPHPGKMAPPLQEWPDSASNQWELQNLVMNLIVQKWYGVAAQDLISVVLWAHDSGCGFRFISKAAEALANPIYSALMHRPRKQLKAAAAAKPKKPRAPKKPRQPGVRGKKLQGTQPRGRGGKGKRRPLTKV